MLIEFTVNKPSNWLQHIADQFGVSLKNNTIHFQPETGEGFLKHFYFSNGLTLNYLRFKFYKEIVFSRKAGPAVPFSPIMFYIHEKRMKQALEDEEKIISSGSPHGIFWPSAHISSVWKFPLNEWISNITIAINHQWMMDLCKKMNNDFILQMISSGNPFYLFEEMTPEMLQVISEIVEIVEKEKHPCVNHIMLEAKTLELLAIYLEKITERPLAKNSAQLNSRDVEILFQVKEKLMENYAETPTLKDLSGFSGFSESKLQKSFKQVFGKSIYQFALHEKMLIARKLLRSKRYSVSEVGYKLGYSNLSHFTKAFNREFGMNPKAFTRKTYVS